MKNQVGGNLRKWTNRLLNIILSSILHCLFDDPGLLQQVLGDLGADDRPSGRELHLQVLAKAAGVVVYGRAGVSEGFDQRVDLQDFLTQRAIVGLRTANKTFSKTKKKAERT